MAQDSGFDTFDSNYDKVNRIDTDTWTKKKIYDESPYLVLPNLKFNMKLGDSLVDFKCFVLKGGEQFGDAIPLPQLSTYTITFRVFDFNYNIIFFGPMEVVDESTGQVQYSFTEFDITTDGVYFFEIELKKEDKVYNLPSSRVRYEIIVRK